jgi:ABC-type nitrate/sulfonate/bicarbonate transport system substrate-binding protein
LALGRWWPVCCWPAAASVSGRPLVKLVQALPAVNIGTILPGFVGNDQGHFRDEGLEIETPTVAPPTAIAGVVSGQLDFAVAGSGVRAAMQVSLVAIPGGNEIAAGAIDAMSVTPEAGAAAAKQGMAVLVSVQDVGIGSSSAWVEANRDTMQRFIDSIMEAKPKLKADKSAALPLIKKWLRDDNPTRASESYDYFMGVIPDAPYPLAANFRDAIDILAMHNPKAAGFDASKGVDPLFVQSAVKRGIGKS